MSNAANELEELEKILTIEQQALMLGDVAELVGLEPQKQSLLESISENPVEASETIEKLREIALRNQELLEAVHSGVRAAKERFDALVLAQKPMSLYGPSGQRATLNSVPTPSVEKRT